MEEQRCIIPLVHLYVHYWFSSIVGSMTAIPEAAAYRGPHLHAYGGPVPAQMGGPYLHTAFLVCHTWR